MANGLRKLIRKARRFSNPLITNRRVRKFGTRLKVEELEERIAPANLTPGDFTSWDVGDTNGTYEADDGAIGLADGGPAVSNITQAVVTVADSTAPVVTIDGADWGANATTRVGIVSSGDIGAVNLTNIPAAITKLELVLISGADDQTGGAGITFDDNVGNTFTFGGAFVAGASATPAGATDPVGEAVSDIGIITITLVGGHPGLEVQLQIETSEGAGSGDTAGTEGDFAGFVSTNAGVTLGSDLGASAILAENITTFQITGGINADGNSFTVTADDSIGTTNIGGITAAAAVAVTFLADASAGGSNYGAVNLGAVNMSNGGSLSVTTGASTGGFGGVTVASITNAGAGGIVIQQGGAGNMGGFTSTGAVSNAAGAAALTVGSTTGALGALNTGGISNAGATNMTFQGLSITGGALGGVTITGTGNVNVSAGATGVTAAVGTGVINVAGGGDFNMTATGAGGFTGLVTTGTIDTTGGSAVVIQPTGTGTMTSGFTGGKITIAALSTTANPVVVGNTAGALGPVTLAGIDQNSTTNANEVQFNGLSIGAIASSAVLTATAGGDILFNADGATTTGTMGTLQITGGILAENANSTIRFLANDGITSIAALSSIGGSAGALTFDGNNAGGSAAGNIGPISATTDIGTGAATVTFLGVNLGNIDAQHIGVGSGLVTFTANDPANTVAGTATGTIGEVGSTTTLVSLGEGGPVTFNMDDGFSGGQTTLQTTGSIAFGGTVTINTNLDTNDDFGSMFDIVAGTVIGLSATNTLTINTNGGATDNTTQRPIGTTTANLGYAGLNYTADGNVGLVTVTGDYNGAGNDVEIMVNTIAAGDPTNRPDFGGINAADTVNNDSVTITGLTSIAGRIDPTGVNLDPGAVARSIIAGGGDATDALVLSANVVVYNGDDSADAAIDADYSATNAYHMSFITGSVTGAGQILTAARNASPLFRADINGEIFQVDASTTPVTATMVYDPNAGETTHGVFAENQIEIRDLAGSGLGAATELTVTTSAASEFDVAMITLATGSAGTGLQLISIEGDLQGDIGQAVAQFGLVEIIVIAGDATASDAVHTFHGTGIQGLGTGLGNTGGSDAGVFSTLTMGPNVIISSLDRTTAEPLTLPGTLYFQFADSGAGATFNHDIAVIGAGSQAIVYGIDGAGDSTADAEYLFEGNGVSTAQSDIVIGGATVDITNEIDPEGLISGAALLARVNVTGITGFSTDGSVREFDGTTSGSWLEFETNIGLINLTTQLDSLSVGIDDNGDAVDNAVLTGDTSNSGNGTDFDRLGGGEAGGAKRGLEPATFVSDFSAALGNYIAQSMGDPGAANISIVVTGSSGPITLTGDALLVNPDHGRLDADNNSAAAALAIGENLEGQLSVPGSVDADILIGIGLDLNNDSDDVDIALDEVDVGHDLNGDGDAVDTTDFSELPGGEQNGIILIGDLGGYDILVYNDINADIVIAGQDQDPEDPGLDEYGDVEVIKAGGDLGDDIGSGNEDIVLVAGELDYIISDAELNADIFVGGYAHSAKTTVEGVGINGAGVVGGVAGVGRLTLINHDVFGDGGDDDQIEIKGDGVLTLQWARGDINADTLGDVYVFHDPQDAGNDLREVVVTTPSGDAIDLADIFVLDPDADNGFDFTTPGSFGTIVVADDVTVTSSLGLELLIDTGNTYTLTYQNYNDMTETDLDTASGNDVGDLNYQGAIQAENVAGVVAEGNITASTDTYEHAFKANNNFGYIVALNGSIDAAGLDGESGAVYGAASVGHIVASLDIDGTFKTEGTMAIGDATSLQADLTSFGLSGVPSWFPGGILAEIGDIGYNSDENDGIWTGSNWTDMNDDFTNDGYTAEDILDTNEDVEAVFIAVADPTVVQGNMFWTGAAMGTIYVPAGRMSADINLGGGFGGIQVPAGQVWVELTVPSEANIDRIIAPQFFDNFVHTTMPGSVSPNSASFWNVDRVGVLIIEGENVVVVGADLDTDGLDVSVTGATTLAVVDGSTILLVGGLAAGSSLDVQGDLVLLTVDGNWDGSVDIDENVDDDSEGVADTIVVTGNVSGTATLEAYNFGELEVQGTNAAESTGSLSGRDSVTFTNLAGATQTLFLDGSNNVSAEYETTFGKLTEVEITGNGKAGVVSVMGSFNASTDLSDLRAIEKAGRTGKANSDLESEGSAHIGELLVAAGSRVNLKDVVVNGALDEFAASKNVRSLWVSDDAGTIDVGNKINKAFIGGDVDEFSARIVKNLLIGGDAGEIHARKMVNSTAAGTVNILTIDGTLINSIFAQVNSGFVNRSIRSVPGTGVI